MHCMENVNFSYTSAQGSGTINISQIHVFIHSELTRINVNLITPSERGPIDDKNFWSKMSKLVDNYNEEEDLLKKMMKTKN